MATASSPKPSNKSPASLPPPPPPPPPQQPSQNGHDHADDVANESEAETVVLGDALDSSSKRDGKVIKTEHADGDGDDSAARLAMINEAPQGPNGRKNSAAESTDSRHHGPKHGSEGDAKSPVPTSPSSRTTSRHTKDTSPTDSARSPVQPATSPPIAAGRGRSASTAESRKRKLRDESHPKSLEPPRQKAKTEAPREARAHPTSPATPGLGRIHKRSQSTQSTVTHTAAGRQRRDLTSLNLAADQRAWSESSSDRSSSPRQLHTPGLLGQARTKRTSHRALMSPARTMTHKRNVDKFGATRLARESEKGDLKAVQAAYEAAPEELDHADFAGIAPLQKAALHGYVDVVEFLLEKGCRTDCASGERDTPLIDAVENGHLEVVKLLLERGRVNPHHQNNKGQRAIDVLDWDYDDTGEIEKALKDAMKKQTEVKEEDSHPGLTQQRSASRLLYNEYNTETLIEKAGDGDIAAVGELINSNIKPSIACGVAASRGGHYDILSILLASGLKADPDPSKHSETPMLVAIGRGHTKIVKLLLEQDDFNPTRRNREGKTYWEISEDRRGPKWEQERDMLKNAYDYYLRTHRSPKRAKKEAPNSAAVRAKRKSSPIKRERSSSPRPEGKRAGSSKSAATAQVPQKGRRLMSGKEMANREVKRRRMVVSEDSTDSESDEDVRPPARKAVPVPRSFSEGEDTKAPKKRTKTKPPRSEGNGVRKRTDRAASIDSDHEMPPKPNANPKIRTRTEKVHPARLKSTATPDADSHDERKHASKIVKSRAVDGKITKRRASDVAMEDIRVAKRTPTASSKSTPAPPEKASTPEVVRERRQEADRQADKQAADAKRKMADEMQKLEDEKEAARKAAEEKEKEEELRRKAAAEAEAKRLAEEEAEAARKREQEEEEARKKAEADAEAKRQQELAQQARQARLSKLPPALRRACELGRDLPLHFSGEELGVSTLFLPLFYATTEQLFPHEYHDGANKAYIMSFQAVGILGLPELDLAHLGPPYNMWKRVDVSRRDRETFLLQYDYALLAQPFRFPMEGTPEFDWEKIKQSVKEAREQFLDMEGLYWIEDTVLNDAAESIESLRPLLGDIKDCHKRRQLHFNNPEATQSVPEKKSRPRKSFADAFMGIGRAKPNGIIEGAKTNGNGNG